MTSRWAAFGPILRSSSSRTHPSSATIPGRIAIGKFAPTATTVRGNTGRCKDASNPRPAVRHAPLLLLLFGRHPKLQTPLAAALELRFHVAGRLSKPFFHLAANIFGAAAEAIVSHEPILLRFALRHPQPTATIDLITRQKRSPTGATRVGLKF